jgi:hypothetical protein
VELLESSGGEEQSTAEEEVRMEEKLQQLNEKLTAVQPERIVKSSCTPLQNAPEFCF